MSDKHNYLSSFYALGYTHEELEAILGKIHNNSFLTEDEYHRLMIAIGLIDNLSTFDGSYNSLKDVPDIIETVKLSEQFPTTELLHSRIAFTQKYLEAMLTKELGDFKLEMEQNKADIDHRHDDRYSLINHDHEGRYVNKEELAKDYVSKEYLEKVIAGIGPGGGGSMYPTYIEPALSVKSNTTIVLHGQSTDIKLVPTYAQNDAGTLVRYTILKGTDIVLESTEIKEYTDNIRLLDGESVTYTFIVDYEDGPIKNTINGDPYPDTSIKAGSISTKVSIKGVALSYYGVIEDKEFDINDINNLTSVRLTSRSCTRTYEMENQKSVFMYPSSFGKLTSIKDANNFEYINSYTLLEITYDSVAYNVYVLTDAVTVEGGFKQAFS